jgi:hypothetical protein
MSGPLVIDSYTGFRKEFMKNTFVVTSFCILLGVSSAYAAEQTWAGQISDAMCGKDHSMMQHGGKKVSARECTLECAKAGSKYVLVSKGKIYEIANQNMKELQLHAGHNVQITGELASDRKTIQASKITMPAGKK